VLLLLRSRQKTRLVVVVSFRAEPPWQKRIVEMKKQGKAAQVKPNAYSLISDD
jgi:hypothetical protein